MISITTLAADNNGCFLLNDQKSDFGVFSSRIARAATLDGNVVITHSGVIHGDRTFNIKGDIDLNQKQLIEYIHENNTLIRLSCREGVFLGAISDLNTSNPQMTLTFLIKEKEI
jgi:hypothetical protein